MYEFIFSDKYKIMNVTHYITSGFEVTKWSGGCGDIYLISTMLFLYQIHDMITYVNSYKI